MTRRRRIAGFVLLTGVAIGLTFYVTRPREPVYQGRALSAWLADLDSPDLNTSEKAVQAVRQIGTNALPHIREMVRAEDSTAKTRMNSWLKKQSLISFRFRTSEDAQKVAMSACGALGPVASEPLPDLKRLLLVARTAYPSSFALAEIGPASIPILVEALTNIDARIRTAGATGLFMMGTNAQTAVPQLQAALKDPDGATSLTAAAALVNSGQDPQTWMPALLELVRHKDSDLRQSTIEYLGEIGSKAQGAVPALLIALEDKDSNVREAAAEALKKIDPEAAAKAGVK